MSGSVERPRSKALIYHDMGTMKYVAYVCAGILLWFFLPGFVILPVFFVYILTEITWSFDMVIRFIVFVFVMLGYIGMNAFAVYLIILGKCKVHLAVFDDGIYAGVLHPKYVFRKTVPVVPWQDIKRIYMDEPGKQAGSSRHIKVLTSPGRVMKILASPKGLEVVPVLMERIPDRVMPEVLERLGDR